MGTIAQVIVPRPIHHPLFYLIPNHLIKKVLVGSFVLVPFKSKTLPGFVIALTTTEVTQNQGFELKEITECPFETIVFSEKDLKFFQWIADYYQLSLGEVFYSAFPKVVFKIPKKISKKNESNIKNYSETNIQLTLDQKESLKKIKAAMSANVFRSFLLFGVTGSGKTEIYIRTAEQALQNGKTALILVPEIALTPQLRHRFEQHFSDQVAVLHSGLTPKTRREYWWNILEGQRKLVVGARSALFAPLQNIGLIVVDEEHDPSYKQADRLRYHARDLALVRALQHQAIAILGSATPSLETFHAALNKKHELLELRTRPEQRQMPHIEIVNLATEFQDKVRRWPDTIFSHKMLEGLRDTLQKGEQAMVFVNRKGYCSFLLCKDCGKVPLCFNCSVSLTYYQKSSLLKCHYCGLQMQAPQACTNCHSHEIKFMGLGTELVEEQLKKLFPTASMERLDADWVSTPKKLESILARFRREEIQILVGTQMLAKGHDFPNVTFIGIVLADLNLHLPDFRAAERTFQLLAQVAGRSGRNKKPGTVILQTFLPDHYTIQAAAKQDYKSFYESEIQHRKQFDYPPFSKMAQLEFRHLKEQKAKEEAQRIHLLLKNLMEQAGDKTRGISYLGPAAASIARIANQFRWHILLKSEGTSVLNAVLKTLRKEGLRFIDVDPVNTL